MRLTDRLLQGINLTDLASVKRGFNRLWAAFQASTSLPVKTQLFNAAQVIRGKLGELRASSYEWRVVLKRIDVLLELMRKATQ